MNETITITKKDLMEAITKVTTDLSKKIDPTMMLVGVMFGKELEDELFKKEEGVAE